MNHKTIEQYLLSLPGARLAYPFGPGVAVYQAGSDDPAKMFALIAEGTTPLRLSLKCDPQLAEVLRARYESVMPGEHLNKKHWNTLILSGQLSQAEIIDLINLSYRLVTDTPD